MEDEIDYLSTLYADTMDDIEVNRILKKIHSRRSSLASLISELCDLLQAAQEDIQRNEAVVFLLKDIKHRISTLEAQFFHLQKMFDHRYK